MLYQIVSHTPAWVFFLFAGLLWLGLRQTATSQPALRRVVVMPLVMTSLSLYGTVSVFGHQTASLVIWLLAAALLATATLRLALPAATRFDPVLQRFTVAGSWAPLLLIMGIFITKYAVGVTLAMHPAMGQQPGFALAIGGLNGAFSGIFCGRALRLLRLARQDERRPVDGLAA